MTALNVERPCYPATTHRYRRVGQSNILCCVRCGQGKQDIVGIPPQSDSHAALVAALRDMTSLATDGAARQHLDRSGILQDPPHGMGRFAECTAPWCVRNQQRIAVARAALDGEPRPAAWGSDVFESECRCGASWGETHATARAALDGEPRDVEQLAQDDADEAAWEGK